MQFLSNLLSTIQTIPLSMASLRHTATEETCDVQGCDKPAERSFNIKQVSRSKLQLKSSDLRSVHLCKEHYKEYKKETKQDRSLDQVYDRWRYCSWGRPPRSLRATARRPA